MKKPVHFKVLGAFYENALAGYGITEPASGDIPQIAVRQDLRRRHIGSMILHALVSYNESTVIKIVNTDAAYPPITSFLESNGIPKAMTQFEMLRAL